MTTGREPAGRPVNHRYGGFGRGETVEAYGFSTDDIVDPVLFEYRQADPRYKLLSARPFRCTLTGVGRWGTHFELETLEGDVWGEMRVPDDFLALMLPMAFDGSRIFGEPLVEFALVFPPGADLSGSTHGNTFASVDFHHETLQRLITAAGVDRRACPWLQPALIPLDASNGSVITQLLHDLAEVLSTEPRRLTDPALFDAAEREFADALIALLSGSGPADLITGTRTSRASLAYRARQRLADAAEGEGMPETLEALCAALDTTARTLQTAFAEQFGIGFREMERAARLQAAHAALARGSEIDAVSRVTDVATRYGFWHLGRFSQYYLEMFGRLPSEVVRERGSAGARR